MESIDVKPGQYKVIHVATGEVEVIDKKPTISDIERILQADCLDTVTLAREGWQPLIVMLVDDTGAIRGLPVNFKATELYHAICCPGTTATIHGTVVIANDSDFAQEQE